MTTQPFRLLLMLASSDLTISEIKASLKAIEMHGSTKIAHTIERIRREAILELQDENVAVDRSLSGMDADRMSEYGEIVKKIERALLQEAELTKSEAAEILSYEIQRSADHTIRLPSPKKVAFTLWVARLLDHVPASEVMHIATRVRNEIMHGQASPSDWPLKYR